MNSFEKYSQDMEDNNSNLNLKACAKMCNECPFGKDSMKGWLGSHSVDDITNAVRHEFLFSCHKHRGKDDNENTVAVENGTHPICKGFLLSAAKSCKQFGGNPVTGQALKELAHGIDRPEEEMNKVLTTWEFKKHHE